MSSTDAAPAKTPTSGFPENLRETGVLAGIGAALFVLLLPLGYLAGAGFGLSYGFSLFSGCLVALAGTGYALTLPERQQELPRRKQPAHWMARAAPYILCSLLFLALAVSHGAGSVVTAHDVLLVPGIARLLPDTPWLIDAFSAGEPGQVYPPGLPILLSPLALTISGSSLLAVWSVLTQAALAVGPLLWALVLKRWCRLPLTLWVLALALAVAMLSLERTVFLGGAIKNAQHLSLAVLLPALLLVLPQRMSPGRFLLGVALLTGMGLAYFTALHLFAAFIGGLCLTSLLANPRQWQQTVIPTGYFAAMTLAAIAMVALYLPETAGDPRFNWNRTGPVETAARIFLEGEERFWFIFGTAHEGMPFAGWRRGLLITALALGLALPICAFRFQLGTRQQLAVLARLGRAASGAAIAIAILAIFVIAGPLTLLTFDYGRWLLWVPQSMLITASVLSLAVFTRAALNPRPKWPLIPAVTACAGTTAIALTALFHDVPYIRAQADSGRPFAAISDLAGQLPSAGPCIVLAQSQPILGGLHHIYPATPLADVLDTVTPCRMANGSFRHAPLPEGTEQEDEERLARWAQAGALFLYGPQRLAAELEARYPAIGWQLAEMNTARPSGTNVLWTAYIRQPNINNR